MSSFPINMKIDENGKARFATDLAQREDRPTYEEYIRKLGGKEHQDHHKLSRAI